LFDVPWHAVHKPVVDKKYPFLHVRCLVLALEIQVNAWYMVVDVVPWQAVHPLLPSLKNPGLQVRCFAAVVPKQVAAISKLAT